MFKIEINGAVKKNLAELSIKKPATITADNLEFTVTWRNTKVEGDRTIIDVEGLRNRIYNFLYNKSNDGYFKENEYLFNNIQLADSFGSRGANEFTAIPLLEKLAEIKTSFNKIDKRDYILNNLRKILDKSYAITNEYLNEKFFMFEGEEDIFDFDKKNLKIKERDEIQEGNLYQFLEKFMPVMAIVEASSRANGTNDQSNLVKILGSGDYDLGRIINRNSKVVDIMKSIEPCEVGALHQLNSEIKGVDLIDNIKEGYAEKIENANKTLMEIANISYEVYTILEAL